MSGDLAYHQRKQNTVLPRALTKSTPESKSEPEPPKPDHESKQPPPARKEPEKPPQEENGSNAKKEPHNQSPPSGTATKEAPELESEPLVEKEKKHPHQDEHHDLRPRQAEWQEKASAPLPPALSKETAKSDHPPAKEAEGHLHSQPPPPLVEHQQQMKKATQWPPK